MKTGKQLTATLEKIREGELYDIFNLLPDIAGGAVWLGEVKDTAMSMQGYLNDDEEYSLEDLRDKGGEYANSECEDYYNNINTRVQALSLWASNELDEEVQMINEGRGFPSRTDLNAQYLCSAMRQMWDAVADQAYENAEGEE